MDHCCLYPQGTAALAFGVVAVQQRHRDYNIALRVMILVIIIKISDED